MDSEILNKLLGKRKLLTNQILNQGNHVRSIKATRQAKEVLQKELERLIDFKSQMKVIDSRILSLDPTFDRNSL
jgi:ribosomal protein L2